jgi:DNA-binding LacI/PurR family transcriptional regulator
MRRRDFITLGGAAAWPIAARGQQGERMRRVGALMGGDESDPTVKDRLSTLVQALAEAGWNDGRNLRLDVRWGAGDIERMRGLAKELVDLRPDAMFVSTPAATKALQHETQTIPIIFAGVEAKPPRGSLARIRATSKGGRADYL